MEKEEVFMDMDLFYKTLLSNTLYNPVLIICLSLIVLGVALLWIKEDREYRRACSNLPISLHPTKSQWRQFC